MCIYIYMYLPPPLVNRDPAVQWEDMEFYPTRCHASCILDSIVVVVVVVVEDINFFPSHMFIIYTYYIIFPSSTLSVCVYDFRATCVQCVYIYIYMCIQYTYILDNTR